MARSTAQMALVITQFAVNFGLNFIAIKAFIAAPRITPAPCALHESGQGADR
jgi:hypothetical protein